MSANVQAETQAIQGLRRRARALGIGGSLCLAYVVAALVGAIGAADQETPSEIYSGLTEGFVWWVMTGIIAGAFGAALFSAMWVVDALANAQTTALLEGRDVGA